MLLFDSHAHYYDRRFLTDAEGPCADELLPALLAPRGEVGHILNVGTSLVTSRLVLEQSARYATMYAAVGIHPEDCQDLPDCESTMTELRAMLGDADTRRRDKIVAIGEIGLDYYEPHLRDKALQQRYFDEQMQLAAELSLPVIIHDREAHGDCLETVLRYPSVRGVFHSFSGSVEMARELTRHGWYISFSGVLTFKNARRVTEVAASVPPQYLLVETDAPYLAPHPHRGKRNDSALMRHTVDSLAELHGMTPDAMAALTASNAARLFGISTSNSL